MAAALTSSPASAKDATGFPSRADAILRTHLAADDFSGVVLIASHGRPLLRRAYGLANRELNAPITPETVFRVGSTSKPFTAVAILQLVESGKIRLDDPIGSYLDAVPAAWSAVTVRQLLNHTSGIHDYVQVNGFIRGPARLDLTPPQLADLVRDMPLDFPPGTRFNYSNTGYALLGMIIERVSKESYPDYVRDHLLRPLGLTHTAYDDSQDIVPGRASGYWFVDGQPRNARVMTPATAYAAGGLHSTVDDLFRWSQALYGNKILKPSSLAQMFADEDHRGYGLGSFVETRHGHRLWDHGGNLPGWAAAFEYYPDDDFLVIVLTNIEGGGAEHIAAELAGSYFGWAPDPTPRAPAAH
ncbi:serine hydrolase domain-containing protein [Caulobacter hibisci]|uniref:Beta-lactamase family protein n=1 Tax=Caulobacter hibisci TaxID=2035993 RepID=A0ABS0T203_9CAUL|nr:serine hydrolase domain-containing protein [Caulobacter hibisci]MBI1685900.1 beta-lactamase family protein [Caulobacter hibisci]